MTFRSVVGHVLTRVPCVPGLVVWLWAESYLRYPRRQHPLFSTVKSRLGYRMRKRAVLVTGQPIEVDPFDVVGGEIARKGAYEPETVAVWRALLAPGMVVVDAGAHVGQYAIIASPLVGPTGSVHAFEPDPDTFRQLEANVRLNRCDTSSALERRSHARPPRRASTWPTFPTSAATRYVRRSAIGDASGTSAWTRWMVTRPCMRSPGSTC